MRRIKELLWPNICPFCFRANRAGFCHVCKSALEVLEPKEPRCVRCSQELDYEEELYCEDCLREERYFEEGRSLWRHELPVSKSLYYFKYKNMRSAVEIYVGEIVKREESVLKEWRIDVLVPVPLSRKRRKKRGYNQAFLLAALLGERMDVPTKELAVRIKETKPQRQLDNRQRKRNVSEVFRLTESVAGKRVLIVDDIYTTGATINELSKTLKEGGASQVYFLTVSIGQGK